ncbi:MAG: hypothetical protein A2277_14880 [Desulfobacterales bacterium RIFOXYA12_FULL_46_15]|nr:MAG: hypothetical protein A2277_14880 [Desulfobacterales bacterium RIFOXYA12_FULL_46_15]
MNKSIAIASAVLLGVSCYTYPPGWILPGMVLFALGCFLWIYPKTWMFIVPAAVPVFDFSPVTGILFFNEFDMVVMTVCLVLYLKPYKTNKTLSFPRGAKLLIVIMSFLYGVSVLLGIYPFEPFEWDRIAHPYSRYSSLRMIKGYIFAVLLIPFLQQGIYYSENIKKFILPGLMAGFGFVAAFVLWERQVFSGLFNFSNDYRITSTFFEMNTGGAFIDGYLSMSLPFIFACFFFWKNPLVKIAGFGLFCAGLYALLVTFSRICYASFLVSMMPLAIGGIVVHAKKWKTTLLIIMIIMVTAMMTLPVLKGGYIKDRFSGLADGIAIRLQHWHDAYRKMSPDSTNIFFGMGPGTFPALYFEIPDYIKPGIYKIMTEKENKFLRLYPGDSLYFGQRILPKPDQTYTLTFFARSGRSGSDLTFPVCEKSILHSFNCNWKTIAITGDGKTWEPYKIDYPDLKIGQGSFYQKRPVEIAIYNGSGNSVIDIDNIMLTDGEGDNLIQNGDFSKGSHFWFFTVDNHLPWHIKNLWVSLLFETGLLGLSAFSLFVLFVFIILLQSIAKKDLLSLILFSSFCGFFTVGLIDSLFDSPRIAFLFYFFSFLSLLYAGTDNDDRNRLNLKS